MSTFSLVIGILLAIALLVPVQAQEDGLVAEWHFDEGSGNILKDSSGNGNDGTIYGANFMEGKFGTALNFDGIDDYVEVPNSNSLNPQAITIEAWILPRSYGSNSGNIVSKASNSGYRVRTNSDGILAWIDRDNINTLGSKMVITLNVWSQVVVTGDASGLAIYINGVRDAKNSKAYGHSETPNDLIIGSCLDFGGEFFNGSIDEVRIYNRALGAEEIKANYETGRKGQIATITSTTTTLPEPESSAVLLHGEKTDVVLGEDILLKLSAVNLITKPPMSVQVMIYPPSGMSVTGSEFVKSGAGIYTTTYTLNPGDGKDIEVHITSNQVGDFNVKGRIVYYFGEEKEKAEDHTLNLPIKVRKEAGQTEPAGSADVPVKAPGFGGGIAIIGILLVVLLIKRNKSGE